MTLLMLLFWLIAGGTLQAAVPAWRHMGQPAFPFLLGVVLYAAVNKRAGYFVATALLAVPGSKPGLAWGLAGLEAFLLAFGVFLAMRPAAVT